MKNNKKRNVQISIDLFLDLCKIHIFEQYDTDTLKRVSNALQDKLQALERHRLYELSKTATTASERENARIEYIAKAEIPKDFRW